MFHNETVHDLVSSGRSLPGGWAQSGAAHPGIPGFQHSGILACRSPGPGAGCRWHSLAPCAGGRAGRLGPLSSAPQSRSMSRYFFLRMETWSLKRTGSSLICEWISGI